MTAATFDLIPWYGPYDEKRFLQCILLCAVAIFISVQAKKTPPLLFQLPRLSVLLLAGLLTIGLISSVAGGNIQASSTEIGLFLLLTATCFTVAASAQTLEKQLPYIIITCIAFIGLAQTTSTLTAYATAMANEDVWQWHPHDFFLNFSNLRFFNQLQSWMLPLAVLPFLIFKKLKPTYLVVLFVAASGWWVLLFTSGSRGTMLGIIVATILVIWAYRKDALSWLKWQSVTAMTGLAIYWFMFYGLPFLLRDTAGEEAETLLARDAVSHGRIYLWGRSWQLFQESPIVGIGPMNFACDPTNMKAAHPHSALIQFATEWGILAAVIIIAITAYGLLAWVRKSKQPHLTPHEKNLRIALFASIITAGTHSLFSGIIVMPLSQIMLVLIIGWMLGTHYNSPPSPNLASGGRLTLPLIATAGLALFAYGLFYPGAPLFIEHSLPSFENMLPRFWQHGKIC